MNSYEELKQWRQEQIKLVSMDQMKLNSFHDELMKKVIFVAQQKVESEWGPSPTHFAFFVMGSAGRSEQSVWSDQDHGIVYDRAGFNDYFLKLGEEITKGLAIAGYEQCDGNVMASNPRWCKPIVDWENQIIDWLKKADWESLRYFSTFYDSRVLVGEESLLESLKQLSLKILEETPSLYKRLVENVGFIKKGVGFFGQLLPEPKGEDAGKINLKQTIFFPYVNSLRLLALVEKITAPSTIERFQTLPKSYETIKQYENDFSNLLDYRLYFQKDAKNYKKVHLLPIKFLSTKEKEQLKRIMKNGHKLFSETKEIIEKRCSR